MPPVLMQLMRHESIETTMRFYVGRSVAATNDVLWDAHRQASSQEKENGDSKRETSRETGKGRAKKAGPDDDARFGRIKGYTEEEE
jgi:hypothetical protein